MTFRPHAKFLAVVWAILLAARSAHADEQTLFRLQVVRTESAGSCADAAQIEREVSDRLLHNPFSDQATRSIEVLIDGEAGAWKARLYLRSDPDEPAGARSLESNGADCSELSKAITLAVALAIAPELPPRPEPRSLPACPPAPPPPPPPAPPPPPPSLHGAVALHGAWSPNLLPRRAFATALSVTLHGDLFGANLGGIFYPEQQLLANEAQLGFGISALFAQGCLWARTAEPQVWSCLGARLGALHAVVYRPEPEHPGDRIWAAAESTLGLRQRVIGRLFIEAGGSAIFPMVRHRFEVDESATMPGAADVARSVYEQGPAAFEVFAGFGLRLD